MAETVPKYEIVTDLAEVIHTYVYFVIELGKLDRKYTYIRFTNWPK